MMKNWKMIMNRYRNSFYFILFSIFFLSENHAFSEPHGPEIIYHPFSKITPLTINGFRLVGLSELTISGDKDIQLIPILKILVNGKMVMYII